MEKRPHIVSFFLQWVDRVSRFQPFPVFQNQRFRSLRFCRLILSAIIAGIAIGSAVSPLAGYDWYTFYARFAFDPFVDSAPMWMYMVITPIAMLPHAFQIFTLLNAVLLIASLYLIDRPHFLLVLTLPVTWILFYGQMDSWIVFASVLGLHAIKNRRLIWLGLAIILLCSKPHIGLPLALYFLWVGRSWKTLLVPLGVFLASLAVYGFWPVAFVRNYLDVDMPGFMGQTINTSLWPWSLFLIPLVAVLWKRIHEQHRPAAVMAATCLIVPYSPAYSLAPLLFITASFPAAALLLLPAWFGAEITAVSGTLFSLGCLFTSLFQRSPAGENSPNEPLQSRLGDPVA